MKNILLLLIITTTISCKAQFIIPVEKVVDYRNTEKGLLGDRDFVYVKDINNLLPKFVGTWRGTFNNKKYEFVVSKVTINDKEIQEVKLLMRYKITTNSGTVLVNTLDLPNNDTRIINGDYLAKTGSYVLGYLGLNAKCGQNGNVFISVYGVNNTKMKLFLNVHGEIYLGCTTGSAEQILPTNWIDLTK